MFRKDPDAAKAWTANKPEKCAAAQREILRHAALMLKPGGYLVYSTCTFNTTENEGVVEAFLTEHAEFTVEKMQRIWPHKDKGEGHFCCVMKREGERDGNTVLPRFSRSERVITDYISLCFPSDRLCRHGDALFALPEGLPDLTGLRVARSGWYLGEVKRDRFEPSHALALALNKTEAAHHVDVPPEQAMRYLRGETLDGYNALNKAWALVCFRGFPLGWARCVDGRLKNKYPPHWVLR
jgi:NOL1/NOP2/fmu family ribosome biogenesis protein